jgi:hypothetical protein
MRIVASNEKGAVSEAKRLDGWKQLSFQTLGRSIARLAAAAWSSSPRDLGGLP